MNKAMHDRAMGILDIMSIDELECALKKAGFDVSRKFNGLSKASNKRFHFYKIPDEKEPTWFCEDRVQNVCGVGKNPQAAKENAQLELEIATSDLHQ